MRTRRAMTALALVTLAMGALAGPSMAGGGTTRFVDDDGRAGPSGCGGDNSVVKKIQKAIDASSAGDTIIVCPGEYTGDLVVPGSKDGLTIVGASPWTAKIRRTAGLPIAGSDTDTMLRIRPGANDVRVQHLVFVVHVPRVEQAGRIACGVFAAILVNGRRAEIVANRVRTTGNTLGRCGLFHGIVVGDESKPVGIQPASALVSHNSVRDFGRGGILASGPQTTATIQRNSIRYWHLDADFDTAAARRAIAARGSVTPSGFGPGSAIEVTNGAQADVYGNEISSGPDAIIISGGFTPALGQGIVVAGADGSSVRQNTIRRTGAAIWVIETDDAIVRANVVSEHIYGILVEDSDDNRISQNQVTQGAFGIYLVGGIAAGSIESENNRITDNTSFSHAEWDCYDDTTGEGTGDTANTWLRNTGEDRYPSEICSID